MSGGYGQEELERAGAARVYEDPADLLRHLDEVGRTAVVGFDDRGGKQLEKRAKSSPRSAASEAKVGGPLIGLAV